MQNNNIHFSLTTNGILLDDSIIELINKYNITIQISLDGMKKTHDENRIFYNGKGSFEIVLNKLKKLQRKCNKNCFQIASVVTPKTVKDFYENFIFFIENGFTQIVTTCCSDYSWASSDFSEFEKQLHLIGDKYIECYKNNIYIDFSLFNKNISNSINGLIKRECDAITGEIAILPNGSILPCGGFVGCHNEKDFYIGDIYNGIDDNKAKSYLKFNSRLENNECKNCKLFHRCQNDCLALNNRVNKNVLIPDEVTCQLNQIAIKESDRIFYYK